MKALWPTLPDEVMERLALAPRLRLAVGPHGNTMPAVGWAAPLKDELVVLLPMNPELEARLGAGSACELRAEDPDGTWTVHARGRLHPGRSAQADERRNELYHWLPEGQSAGRLNAAHFFPEIVDYQRTMPDGEKKRAMGPVPGGAPPSFGAAWTRVAFYGVTAWFFVMFGLDWLYLLLVDDTLRNPVILGVMVLIGGALLSGTNMLGVRLSYQGWRRGTASRAAAEPIFRTGLGAEPLYTTGLGLIGGALLLLLPLWLITDGRTAFAAVITSGAPLILPFTAARYREKAGA